jgi:hypothetical protein
MVLLGFSAWGCEFLKVSNHLLEILVCGFNEMDSFRTRLEFARI